jgi:hypothetical protein
MSSASISGTTNGTATAPDGLSLRAGWGLHLPWPSCSLLCRVGFVGHALARDFSTRGRLSLYVVGITNRTQPQPFTLQTVQPCRCSCSWTSRSWPQEHRSEPRGEIAVTSAAPSPARRGRGPASLCPEPDQCPRAPAPPRTRVCSRSLRKPHRGQRGAACRLSRVVEQPGHRQSRRQPGEGAHRSNLASAAAARSRIASN